MMKSLHILVVVVCFCSFHINTECRLQHLMNFRQPKLKPAKNDRNQLHSHSKLQVRIVDGSPLKFCGQHGELVTLSDDHGKLVVKCSSDAQNFKFNDVFPIYDGIFGIYKLHLGFYVACISKSDSICTDGLLKDVKSVQSLSFVKVPSSQPKVNITSDALIKQNKAEQLLQRTFLSHSFLYSTGSYDITRSVQENHGMKKTTQNSWRDCDERYFWNLNCLAPLIEAGCPSSLIIPVTNAWIMNKKVTYKNKSYLLSLLSRRSRTRQGPRFIKRGSDVLGHVANFVETEQILQTIDTNNENHNNITAFVQVRGSVPLLWKQKSSRWKLQSDIDMTSNNITTQVETLKSHLVSLYQKYCTPNSDTKICDKTCNKTHKNTAKLSIIVLNLIDRKGTQGRLGVWFYNAMKHMTLKHTTKDTTHNTISNTINNTTSNIINTALNRSEVICEDFLSHRLNTINNNSSGANSTPFLTRFIWFDYHYKCKDVIEASTPTANTVTNTANTDTCTKADTKTDNNKNTAQNHTVSSTLKSIKQLYPLLRSVLSLREGGYFLTTTTQQGGVEEVHQQKQTSVIRTNCIDCLDRTNVVQTVISRWVLQRQLNTLHKLSTGETNAHSTTTNEEANTDDECVLELPDQSIETTLRQIWADNGDHLSMLYAGSRAMKRDVTRTGRRTRKGAFDDAMAGARRYFVNNFRDRDRQRGVDLLLGKCDSDGRRTKWISNTSTLTSLLLLRGGATDLTDEENSQKEETNISFDSDDSLDSVFQEILRDIGKEEDQEESNALFDSFDDSTDCCSSDSREEDGAESDIETETKSVSAEYLKTRDYLKNKGLIRQILKNSLALLAVNKKLWMFLLISCVLSLVVCAAAFGL